MILLNSLVYFPYVEIEVGEDGKVVTFRKKIIDYFEKKYDQLSFYRKIWKDFHQHSKKYAFQRFF